MKPNCGFCQRVRNLFRVKRWQPNAAAVREPDELPSGELVRGTVSPPHVRQPGPMRLRDWPEQRGF